MKGIDVRYTQNQIHADNQAGYTETGRMHWKTNRWQRKRKEDSGTTECGRGQRNEGANRVEKEEDSVANVSTGE